MSDRCEKFVTMPAGSGYDDRCAVCGVPCEEHPPLSPIALDFNIPEKRYGIEFMDANDYDPNKKTAPGMQPVWLAAYDQAILAQHLAIVARVAQEEREKARREFAAECRTRLVAHDPVGLRTGPLYDWLTSENAHDLADKVRNIRRERDEFSDALVELHGEHEALSALVREYKEAQADYDNNLMTRDGLGHDRVQRIQRAQSALLLRGTP